MNINSVYKIFFKNGNSVKLAGKNITEAYSQTGSKTADGNIDFSLLDFYLRIPIPQIEEGETKEFQLILMKDKASEWEFSQKSNDSELLDGLMNLKVKVEGYFSAAVIDLYTEKAISWKWSSR